MKNLKFILPGLIAGFTLVFMLQASPLVAQGSYNHKKSCLFQDGCKVKVDRNCFGSMACGDYPGIE